MLKWVTYLNCFFGIPVSAWAGLTWMGDSVSAPDSVKVIVAGCCFFITFLYILILARTVIRDN